MDDETLNIRIKLRDAARFAAEVRATKREIDDLGDKTGKAGRKARQASRDYTLLGLVLRQVKVAAATAGIVGLGALAGASAGGVIALVASLVPLVGLMGVLPGLGALAGQGMGVAALGLMGVTAAVGGLNSKLDPKKFALLQRPAQDFALALDNLKPRILGLQRSVQRGMFPGLTAGLKAASPAITALQGPLAGTGRVLGGFGRNLGQLVGSHGFLADLRSQAKFNNVQLGRLGGAGVHVVNIFRNLMVAARPLVSWMVRLVASWAASADQAVATGRHTGKLTGFFHDAQVTASRFGRILMNLGVALFNVGRVGKKGLGDDLLVGLVRSTRALRDWTGSKGGIKQITLAFSKSRTVLSDVGRTALGMSKAIGPDLISLLRDFSNALRPLLSQSGSSGGVTIIKLYAQGLGALARAIGWLERNVPGARSALSALIGLMIVAKISKFGAAIGLLTSGMKYLTVATGLATAAGVAEMSTFALIEASATGMWLAITGPVGLTIIGIAAVSAAFYLLYTRVTWFHNAADATFSFIKSHWPLLAAILTGPLGLAVLGIVSSFATIRGAIWDTIHWAVGKFNALVDFIRRIPGRIGNAVTGFFSKIAGGAGSLYHKVTGRATGGIVRPGEVTLVGERGPELAVFPGGTRIDPSPRVMSRAPRSAPVRRMGADGGGRPPIHVHNRTVLKVDRRVLAEAVNDAVADEKAGG